MTSYSDEFHIDCDLSLNGGSPVCSANVRSTTFGRPLGLGFFDMEAQSCGLSLQVLKTNPRNPGSPSENGNGTYSKYYVEEVIVHPNHPLTFGAPGSLG